MLPFTIYRSLFILLVLTVFSACISDDDPSEGASLGVVLFSVDCGDCRQELPEIQRLWDLRLGVPIVLIARENTEEQIQAHWQQAQLTMIYSPQADRKVYSLFAASRVPRIYISDAQGVIRYSHTDEAMPTAEQLADEIRTLLKKNQS